MQDEQRKHKGQLVNFREVMQDKTDVHLKRQEDHPAGFRFFVNVTEDWVKKEQPWPANKRAEEKRKQKEKEKKEKEGEKEKGDQGKEKGKGNGEKKDNEGKQGEEKKPDVSQTNGKKQQDDGGNQQDQSKQKVGGNQEPAQDEHKKQDQPQDEHKKQDQPQDSDQKQQNNDDKSKPVQSENDKPSSQPANDKDSTTERDNSGDKQERNISSANQNESDDTKKSQAASEAQAKHPGGAQEQHTLQRGQQHYWKNGGADEADWRRQKDDSRPAHHAAFRRSKSADSDEGYHSGDKSDDEKSEDKNDDNDESKDDEDHKTEYQNLREKYSPEEIALLRHLQNEAKYAYGLEQNDGKQVSPVAKTAHLTEIDVNDQFTPDNWIPRSTQLTRMTGKHPMNAEPPLTKLFEAGLITPNELHYVRNHGAVPRLYWETHTLDVEDGKLVLTMDELVSCILVSCSVRS